MFHLSERVVCLRAWSGVVHVCYELALLAPGCSRAPRSGGAGVSASSAARPAGLTISRGYSFSCYWVGASYRFDKNSSYSDVATARFPLLQT